ncbi:Sec23-binding domain of Sec16-domain-containing protein [Gamsiella multidivaricata]|uniref:Sec23-binding domain of Sec16-domain-containing protein n=1 Tax=Gamsiella multidivaricata TaxID=101098 RepID=UPI00221EC34B|nr:Sec23-binding domain of Sec16-domain-containing protein [Gamsiella multidivaricata]KAI7825987.1 Sec23-binding domain of Sec16-domain-containing protein [Gamsiella multidivaricata]
MSSNLWAHALVISSCVNKELWKEAVNGFVNQELTANGSDLEPNGREALRVLYALFSGQTQNAITELIPPGLRVAASDPQNEAEAPADQFVTAESLSMMKPVEEPKVPGASLSQWRDTLAMILSNRTSGDQTAISSLGDLLMKEGWVEAAHICYLLSPQNSVHSGPDAQLNRLVLIGADANPFAVFPFYKNVAAFQKTEVYEFACALRSSGATGGLPFLQAYKLNYIWTLVDWGMFSEAGRYLESVEAIVKSQTKGSPYYNIIFLERLREITERLAGSSQLAVTGESWFAKKVPKPTIGGIFDALDSKISKFIAGDNEQPKPDVVETKANAVESGPFANAPALPDLSNIPPRAISRSSNSARTANQAAPGGNSRRSSRPSLEVPKTDVYGHLQPMSSYPEPAPGTAPATDLTAGQDQAYNNYDGYDQNGQYNAEAYTESNYNAGYENQDQGYGYDASQGYDGTYQGIDATGYDQQNQYQEQAEVSQEQQHAYAGEENYQVQTGFEGQQDTQYDAQYDAQYGTQQDSQYNGQYDAQQSAQYDGQYENQLGMSTGETVAALAVQPDVALASADSANFSTQAALGSEKPPVNEAQNPAVPEGAAATEGYDTTYGQQAEEAEYNYAQDSTYNGEYQQGEYQTGEYQQGEYQQGEYQQGEYQQGEYQAGQEHQQDGNYDYLQYDQSGYHQDSNNYGEQGYDQAAYQDQTQYQNVESGDQGLGVEYNDGNQQNQGQEQPVQGNLGHQEAAPAAVEQQNNFVADEPTAEQQGQVEIAAPTEAASARTGGQAGDDQNAEYQQGEYDQGYYQQGEYQQGEYQQGEAPAGRVSTG